MVADDKPRQIAASAGRPTFTLVSVACPLLLLCLYAVLSAPQGAHVYDNFASRNLGAGIAAMGMLFLFVGGLLIVGLVTSVVAIRRSEKPGWLSRVSLAAHALAMLTLFGKFF